MKFSNRSKELSLLTSVFTFSLIAGFTILAWIEPGSTPPNDNVDAPINTGSTLQSRDGALRVNNEFQSTMGSGSGQLRMVANNYGAIWRNDGNDTYLLFTNSGDQYGSWNSLRPFYVNNSTGVVTLGQGLNVNSSATIGPNSQIRMSLYSTSGDNYNPLTGVNDRDHFHYSFAVPSGKYPLIETPSDFWLIGANSNLKVDGSAVVANNISAGAFYYTSDASLKENITPISGSLEKIGKLNGVYFNWKEDGEPSMGLIAQDVEKVFPEAVLTNDSNGMKSVDYGKMVAPLIEAVKAQQREIADLKTQINELQQCGSR